MAKSEYDWENGAPLGEHSQKKLKILREYLTEYLNVRCSMPARNRFRLAVVDGFAGGGRYKCGTPGSPIVFLETIRQAAENINTMRAAEGMAQIDFDLLLIINDASLATIELCKEHLAPILGAIKDAPVRLHVELVSLNERFESAYPTIKQYLAAKGFQGNVIFNLDQYGNSHVELKTLSDILRSYAHAEIFFTFAINTLLTYLPKSDPIERQRRLSRFNLTADMLSGDDTVLSNNELLGAAERLVFDVLNSISPFTSPFSIHNPNGWRYWMIHFANHDRARQVYNDVLHRNASMQAHFGRSGLRMLAYNPEHDASLYLFGDDDRRRAIAQLHDDIPVVVANSSNAISISDFYQSIYNETPSHSDDIHAAIIENPDLAVITPSGGERRVANTISRDDTLILRPQRSFFSFLGLEKKPTGKD